MSTKNKPLGFIENAISLRKEENRYRTLQGLIPKLGTSNIELKGKSYLNFCSNDYLGLSSHPKVIERASEFLTKYGAGSGASRLVSGSLTIHQQLEEKLASVFGLESALLFNSGFQANTSILPALADRNSLVIADKKCHNSLIQGALLSRAVFKRFRHNDLNHLENLLKEACSKPYNRIWVVSETVFGMDGDRSDVQGLIDLSEKYGALFYSDDAHALGVLGEKGLGLNAGKAGIDLSLGTFGKAFGGFGAFAGCSQKMKEHLINFSSGFIYTTALPPSVIGALDVALDIVPEMNEERAILLKRAERVLSEIKKSGFDTGATESQIIPVIVGREEETLALSEFLMENAILASAIRPPTVEPGASRIRLTLTSKHTEQDICRLLATFLAWKK